MIPKCRSLQLATPGHTTSGEETRQAAPLVRTALLDFAATLERATASVKNWRVQRVAPTFPARMTAPSSFPERAPAVTGFPRRARRSLIPYLSEFWRLPAVSRLHQSQSHRLPTWCRQREGARFLPCFAARTASQIAKWLAARSNFRASSAKCTALAKGG